MDTLLRELTPPKAGLSWGLKPSPAQLSHAERARAVVVDNDSALRSATSQYLVQAGYEVRQTDSGNELYAMLGRFEPDLIVLDWDLRDERGMETCLQLRDRSDAAIVLVTSNRNRLDALVGLETGADDYITKPYSPRELLARARAILRRRGLPRMPGSTGSLERMPCYRFAKLMLSTSRRELKTDQDEEIALTGGEYRILCALLGARGAVVSSAALSREPGAARVLESNSIASSVYHLRQKLLRYDPASAIIGSVRSIGYVIKVHVDVTYE